MKLIYNRNFLISTFLLSVISLLIASTPKIITFSTQKDFEKGKPKGVSITSQGEIYLAPAIEEILKPEMPFIWCGAADHRGNIYVAGGNTGQVYKIDSRNQSSLVVDSEDLQIYAMAVDKQNNLYIGTSPKGAVYKIPYGSEVDLSQALFFDPEEIYIWSLAFDNQNYLYVATGEKGNIYKIDPNGNGVLFYESGDVHIRKITFDPEGNLLAGTSNKGLIVKIDVQGQAFVLYDSPLAEITDIIVDPSGNTFVSVVGEQRIHREPAISPTTTPSDVSQTSAGAAQEEDELVLPVQPISAVRAQRFGKKNSELYKIEMDGTVRTLWSSRKERVHALILDESQNIILGTGEPGRLYSINSNGGYTLLTELEELQVTFLGRDVSGNPFMCTSNTGKVYRVSTAYISKGEYLSEVVDASVSSHWGSIHWESDLPQKTGLVFYSRSGNTEKPDKSWSAWSEKYTHSVGELIQSPPARFIQLKTSLSSKSGKYSPVLKEVSFSYLQKNIAPQINEIVIYPAGDYYPNAKNQVATNSHLDSGSSTNNNSVQNQSPGRKIYRKGFRSVGWNCKDANGDQLSFDLFYKGENEKSWKTLVKDFRGFVYSWDSELFPDGKYFIKIISKDNLSNPPAMTLSSEKISQPFKVDNSGPKISKIKFQANKKGVKISFTVEDELMNIQSVEYGLNAEDWKLVYPVDGICDSRQETFELKIDSYVKGVNTIVIKSKDALGNTGFGKTNINL